MSPSAMLFSKGDVDDAIVHSNRPCRIEPDNAEARCNLGDALLKIGNVDEAVNQNSKGPGYQV